MSVGEWPLGRDGRRSLSIHAPTPRIPTMKHVLFVCVHNSARSQMAEAFLNQTCPEDCLAQSAGLEPGTLNPLVVEAMNEIGIDLSKNQTKSVNAMLTAGLSFSHVITVCDEASAERCPVVPGPAQRLHWSFPDPSALTGPRDERLQQVRTIRDAIRRQIEHWCSTACAARPVPTR